MYQPTNENYVYVNYSCGHTERTLTPGVSDPAGLLKNNKEHFMNNFCTICSDSNRDKYIEAFMLNKIFNPTRCMILETGDTCPGDFKGKVICFRGMNNKSVYIKFNHNNEILSIGIPDDTCHYSVNRFKEIEI